MEARREGRREGGIQERGSNDEKEVANSQVRYLNVSNVTRDGFIPNFTLAEVFRERVFVEVKEEFVVAQWRHSDTHLGQVVQIL